MPIENALFSKDEYDRRIRQTRETMAEFGIDVLVVTNPSNQHWLTGYDGWSFYVHQAVILPLEGAPYWWGRAMDAEGARRTVWMEDAHVLPYPDRYVQAAETHPMEDLASRLRIMGFGTKRIGVEMETYFFTARAFTTIAECLPGADIMDASSLVNWQRLVKSEEELAHMRRAARISDLVIRRAVELAEPGMKKHELAGELYKTAVTGEADSWGDYPAIVPLLSAGGEGAGPHLTWNGEALISPGWSSENSASASGSLAASASLTILPCSPGTPAAVFAHGTSRPMNSFIPHSSCRNRCGSVASRPPGGQAQDAGGAGRRPPLRPPSFDAGLGPWHRSHLRLRLADTRPAMPLPLRHLQAVDLSLGLAIGPWSGRGCGQRRPARRPRPHPSQGASAASAAFLNERGRAVGPQPVVRQRFACRPREDGPHLRGPRRGTPGRHCGPARRPRSAGDPSARLRQLPVRDRAEGQ
ncbi:M24 family metallopeptidase [Mangrovicoccus ximenensis]|uniref:M24 family metallopeptidase n=1 Tax=Mangrovicoccus ximenensis TaxID=1911570 RepID=UPI000D3B2E24|nr:Xaa-Pro peptidase family protein [Mangrovicoccus ximenensis]